MKKTWKKLLAAGCVLSMLMTASGMSVLADDVVATSEAEIPAQDVPEEIVGAGAIQVGDGVTATFDANTGAVKFTSSDGELWPDWVDKLGVGRDEIKSIKVISGTVYLPADSNGYDGSDRLFGALTSLINLDLSGFDTSNVTNMRYMFYDCRSLTNLDLSGFDTSNVTDMECMFERCLALTNLNLSGFDTSNVKDMGCMFYCCLKLPSLDLSNFNTSKVTHMQRMFDNCSSLTNLDLSGFDTSNVYNMYDMFTWCSSLTELDLSSFDTSKVEAMYGLFDYCSSLVSLDLSSFDTSNVLDGGGIFLECPALSLLKTPKKNVLSIDLPGTMYDESGNAYKELPILSESIVLTRDNSEADIANYTVTLSPTSYAYDGEEKQPVVTVKNGNAILTAVTDYIVSYDNNINAGTATVRLIGSGRYKGEKTVTFTINKADARLVFSDSTVTKKTTDAAFTNILLKTTDGTVTFKSSNTKVATVDSTSGLITIKGAGTTTIAATAAEGKNYKAGIAAYSLTVEAPASTPTSTASGFSDVQNPNHAYYKAIYWAADAGITKGYSDGTFGVNKSCTRGEMIMFLWRYAGKPAPRTVSKSPFKDVAKTHAFFKAILWASQKGITKGYPDGTFGINRNVSRGECMMFLWRVKNKSAPKAVSKSPFKDVATTNAFYKAILWGYQKKITTGYTSGAKKGTFGINENCTRGQIVTFLYRAK